TDDNSSASCSSERAIMLRASSDAFGIPLVSTARARSRSLGTRARARANTSSARRDASRAPARAKKYPDAAALNGDRLIFVGSILAGESLFVWIKTSGQSRR